MNTCAGLFSIQMEYQKTRLPAQERMNQMERVCAVIVAAGSSTRMGGSVPKQLLKLCGEPLLVHTLRTFDQSGCVDEAVLVCRQEDIPVIGKLAKPFPKIRWIVPGGSTRQESVAAGVRAAGDCEIIAIHDGARPLVTQQEIAAVIADCKKWRASSLAVPVVDTIKEVDAEEFVTFTPNRSLLRAVQTPQVFFREEYEQAMEKARAAGKDFTDDCQLMEFSGRRVHLCMGRRSNLKVTTPEDLLYARAILEERQRLQKEENNRKDG